MQPSTLARYLFPFRVSKKKNSRGSTSSTETLPVPQFLCQIKSNCGKTLCKAGMTRSAGLSVPTSCTTDFLPFENVWKLTQMLVIHTQFGKTSESTLEQQLVFKKNHNCLRVSHSFVQSQEYLLIFLIFKGYTFANLICT